MNNFIEIKNIEQLIELSTGIDKMKFFTNNYMLEDELLRHISKGDLYGLEYEGNVLLLLKKFNFFRLYYTLTNLDANPILPESHIVQEILYRGEKHYPEVEIAYWEKQGFELYLGRELHVVKVTDEPWFLPKESDVYSISNSEEIVQAQALIDKYLDQYTGDQLTLNELETFAKEGTLYGVKHEGQLAGILQAEVKNKVNWLGHIVVSEEYRGLGLSKKLVEYYLQESTKNNCIRCMLWVRTDNEPAKRLYKKYGYSYMNKSTISLLKK